MFRWGSSREVDDRLTRLEIGAGHKSDAPRSVRQVWGDGFGLMATRSLQVIIVLLLTAAIIWGMRTLTTVVIPILLALIFASTFAPVTGWLRRRNVPSALSAVIVLLGIVVILSAIGWLIVWAVRDQWDDLSSQAQDGIAQVIDWSKTLPFLPDQSQLHDWGDQITDFLTSAQFGSGRSRALAY